MENFIITGGTGHIGVNLVRRLKEHKDIKIKLLVLPGEDISPLNDYDTHIAYGNVLDRNFLEREIEPCSTVIHMAGIIDISSENKDLLYKVNVDGTRNIADIALKNKVKRLVYTSSVHAIPPLKKGAPMSEPELLDENKVVGDYAKSKAIAAKYIYSLVKQGLPAVVLYPAGVIGPNDYKVSSLGSLILDIANKKIKARVNGAYNFVDVRDLCDGIVSAVLRGGNGEGYILSGNRITIDGIFQTVNSFMNRKKFTPKIATWFVKMFSGLAELWYKVRGKKPLFTKYSLYTITENCNFLNQKARDELGFCPRPVVQSIVDALMWFYINKPELLTDKAKGEIASALSLCGTQKSFAF